MNNIVIIAEKFAYRDHCTYVRNDMINYIKNNNKEFNITIFFSDHNPKDVHNKIIELNPKVILFMDIANFSHSLCNYVFVFDMNISAKIGILIEDTYLTSCTLNCPYVKKTSFLVIWYKNELIIESYKKALPNKLILNFDSRFINIERFKDYQMDKKYDILMYGCRQFYYTYKRENIISIQNYIKKFEDKNNIILDNNSKISFYSVRERLLNLLNKHKNRYNFKLCPEIGDYANNEDLSNLINQSYLTIVCSTIADVMVFKHLEISASKSVILGSYPSDYKDLFEGNIVEIDEFMSDDEILAIIDNALQNKVKLAEMADRLYDKVRAEHNLDKAVESFNSIIKKVLNF
jgi:hypothetical protein